MLLEAFSVDGTLARVLLDTLGSAASSMVQVGELIEKARYSQPTVIRRLLSKGPQGTPMHAGVRVQLARDASGRSPVWLSREPCA
jgi:hypothetical protein